MTLMVVVALYKDEYDYNSDYDTKNKDFDSNCKIDDNNDDDDDVEFGNEDVGDNKDYDFFFSGSDDEFYGVVDHYVKN